MRLSFFDKLFLTKREQELKTLELLLEPENYNYTKEYLDIDTGYIAIRNPLNANPNSLENLDVFVNLTDRSLSHLSDYGSKFEICIVIHTHFSINVKRWCISEETLNYFKKCVPYSKKGSSLHLDVQNDDEYLFVLRNNKRFDDIQDINLKRLISECIEEYFELVNERIKLFIEL